MSERKTEIEPQKQESPVEWVLVAAMLWQSRKYIALIAGGVTMLALVISLLLPEYFRSTAVILPDADKSRLGSLGGLSDLAAMAGVSTGSDGSLIKLYPTIIRSESVLKSVLYAKYKTQRYQDSVNLIQYWEVEEKTPELIYESGLNALQDGLGVSSDSKLNVITLTIETREPQLSGDILNTVIMELNKFVLTKRITNATEQRKWIEKRLKEVKEDLEKAENILKEFREKNRGVTANGSPQLYLAQERLMREVQINSTMYIELKKQFELVKIEELKSVPIINVLDYGRPAARKERPRRSIIVLGSLFLSIIGTMGFLFVKEQYGPKILKFKDELFLPKLRG